MATLRTTRTSPDIFGKWLTIGNMNLTDQIQFMATWARMMVARIPWSTTTLGHSMITRHRFRGGVTLAHSIRQAAAPKLHAYGHLPRFLSFLPYVNLGSCWWLLSRWPRACPRQF